jgi:cobalt-zinc-cadmium efflux system outer membrane protein
MHVPYARWAGLVAVVLCGCSTTTPRPSDIGPRPLGRDLPSALSQEQPAAVAFQEPTGPLTLRDALSLALLHNPRLAASAWSVRMREAERLQTHLRPNPRFTVEMENVLGSGDFSGFDVAETTVHLSQLLETSGKRGKRLDVATGERDLARWDAETVRLDVLTATAHSFIDVLAAQEELTIAGELVEVAEQLLASVTRRVRAGSVSPVEQSRARVELQTVRVDVERLRRQLEVRRHRLAAHWGGVEPRFAAVRGDLETTVAVPELDSLAPLATDNPALARYVSEARLRQASLALAQAEARPDLEIQAGLRTFQFERDHAFVFGVGIPLPLFDRNQGRAQAAHYAVHRLREERRQVETTLRSALAVMHQELQARDVEVRTLRDEVLPEAERAFTTAQTAYQRGALRLSDVLDTERQLFELRTRYFRALAEHHHAATDLERIIARPLGSAVQEEESP